MYDCIIVSCFGTNDISQFNKTFKNIFNQIKSKANADMALALLNLKIANNLSEQYIEKVFDEYSSKNRVLVVPLLLADGTQYQLLKKYCSDDKYVVDLPILEKYQKEVSELLNEHLFKEEDSLTILLAHGSEQFDNHEYFQLEKHLRDDIKVYLAEGNGDLESLISSSSAKTIKLFTLMFSQGHHYKNEVQQFISLCQKHNKQYYVYNDSLGSLQQFQNLIIDKTTMEFNK